MHTITIQVCKMTTNTEAVNAVSEFITANIHGEYSYARDVNINGSKLTVVEATPKDGELTLEANFMVSMNK